MPNTQYPCLRQRRYACTPIPNTNKVSAIPQFQCTHRPKLVFWQPKHPPPNQEHPHRIVPQTTRIHTPPSALKPAPSRLPRLPPSSTPPRHDIASHSPTPQYLRLPIRVRGVLPPRSDPDRKQSSPAALRPKNTHLYHHCKAYDMSYIHTFANMLARSLA